jgi:hypothetical protein
MKSKVLLLLFTGILIAAAVPSCKKNKKLTPKCDGSHPTYNSGIKTIIDNNCTGSSCHANGSPYGIFTNYQGLQPFISNGTFKRDVLDKQIMPKNKNLSQDELNKIQCWVDNGFPEN